MIEAALPLAAINAHSVREGQGRVSPLHLWWSHKPAAACRAALLAALLPAPEEAGERERLLRLVASVAEASPADQAAFAAARAEIAAACGPEVPTALDPFSGSGSIPAEAQRLGLRAEASDLNPVAAITATALLRVPAAFRGRPAVHPGALPLPVPGTDGLAEDVLHYGRRVLALAAERIGGLYPPAPGGEPVIAWLWARTAPCPNPACGREMPLVHSFQLCARPGRHVWARPEPGGEGITLGPDPAPGLPEGTVDRRAAHCLHCGSAVPLPELRARSRGEGLGLRLLAMVAGGRGGRHYLPPDPAHEALALGAVPAWAPDTDLPDRAIGFAAHNYGITRHRDLYTGRQLTALTTFADLIGAVRREVVSDAQAAGLPADGVPLRDGGSGATARGEAVALYLALALDRAAARWCTFARWHRTRENIEHPFASPGLHMLWDFVEANPFSAATGNWLDAVLAVAKALGAVPAAHADVPPAVCAQADAAAAPTPPGPLLVCTDPPYFDTLPYADMADLFYVWLRPMLRDTYPEFCATLLSPKAGELVADPHRFGGREGARAHFLRGLETAFRRLGTAADPRFPLTIFYAFREDADQAAEGWEAVLTALLAAGLRITATWPLRTEHAQRLRSRGSNALASSILLVCRPRPQGAPTVTRGEWLRELRQTLPPALDRLTRDGIAPVDLAQAAIGPGMAAFSRHASVLLPDGRPMSVGEALAVIAAELDAGLTGGALDAVSGFCLAWLEAHGFTDGPFGEADVLARARGVAMEALVAAGLLEARAGRVRLRRAAEPATAEHLPGCAFAALQTAVRALEVGGGPALADAAASSGLPPGDLAALARRLYTVCAREGGAADARAYNAAAVALDTLAGGGPA